MKYPIFASIILFSLALMFSIHRTRNGEAKRFQAYLDEEARANNTRRKPLDHLHYITIPLDMLPTEAMNEDPQIAEYLSVLHDLSQNPIVNLTGITNTELKLTYGAPNIELLSRYDASYTILARTLDRWGRRLYENDYVNEAQRVLEFAVSTDTDVTSTYTLLASIYEKAGQSDRIQELIEKASGLNSLSKKPILNHLRKAAAENEEKAAIS